MTPEEVVAQFLGTTDTPNKPIADYGRMKMREQREAQQRAARMKAVSEYLERQKQNWPYSGEPYGQSRPDAPPAAEQSVGPMTEARRPDPNLISSALAGAPMAAIAGLMGRGAAPAIGRAAPKVAKAVFEGSRARPWLLGGGALGAATELLEDKPTVQGAVAKGALSVADVASPPLSIAAQMLGYAPEAEAMPYHSLMKYLKSARGELGATPLFTNPTRSELGELWKSAKTDSFTNDITPTLRLMRDLKTPDTVYAWDGTKLLHDDVMNHIGRKDKGSFTGGVFEQGVDIEGLIDWYKKRPQYASGGLVSKGLKMLFPNAAAPMHVVKPKGGNWLTGSVEGALGGLKYEEPPIKGATRTAPEVYNSGNSERVVWKDPDGRVVQVNEGPIGHWSQNADLLDAWIDGPLTKYVKTRMASPEDEVRALAEEGIGYVDFSDVGMEMMGRKARHKAGMPLGNAGESAMARGWEDVADVAATPTTAYKRMYTQGGLGNIIKDPWLEKVSPNTPVYGSRISGGVNDLGFDHLVDELSNALDPNSGLPRHLQLTPEAVKQMSMEKAVRRVADINAWRAEQKVAASKELADKASVVREYADNNPKGLRWVELKAGDPDSAMYTLRESKLADGSPHYEYVDKTGEPVAAAGRSPEEAAKNLKDTKGEAALQQQLRYEGDTMGHCVGGYCDDVLTGRSRIFSLRDAKGQPHVTIEAEPPMFARHSKWGDLSQEEKTGMLWNLGADGDKALLQKYGDDLGVYFRADGTARFMPPQELLDPETISKSLNPRIKQIKGKQNRKPNDEYLPFVQDFVRNSPLGGQWADVGDLQNTGLTKHPTGKYVSDAEAAALAQRHFGDVRMGNKPDDVENPWQYANRIRRYDPDMLSDTDKAFLADWEAGNFASGGPVRTYPKPTDSPATTGTRGRSPADVVNQFLSEQI